MTMKTHFSRLLFTTGLFFAVATFAHAQTAAGKEETESEYELGHVKNRSEKAHKKSDEANKKNLKAQEKVNKEAERNRKDKLNKKKKKEDSHEFKF